MKSAEPADAETPQTQTVLEEPTTLALTDLSPELIEEIIKRLSFSDAMQFMRSHKGYYTNEALRAVTTRKYKEEYLN